MATVVCPEAFIEIRSSQPFLIPGLSLEILVVRRLEEERRRKKTESNQRMRSFIHSFSCCMSQKHQDFQIRYMQNHHYDD